MKFFKEWHERLRPAADDTKRKMCFIWEVKFKENNYNWIFKLDTEEPLFQQVKVTGPNKDDNAEIEYKLYD